MQYYKLKMKRSNPFAEEVVRCSKQRLSERFLVARADNSSPQRHQLHKRTLELLWEGARRPATAATSGEREAALQERTARLGAGLKQLLLSSDGTLQAPSNNGVAVSTCRHDGGCESGSGCRRSANAHCSYCSSRMCDACAENCSQCLDLYCRLCSLHTHDARGTLCLSCYT